MRNARTLIQLVVVMLFLQFGIQGVQYHTYLESWDSQWETALQGFKNPSGTTVGSTYDGVTVYICFAGYTTDGTVAGLQFSMSDMTTAITYVHSKGGRVYLSFGGNSYAPGAIYFLSTFPGFGTSAVNTQLANSIASIVTTYGFDGVDFDVEDSTGIVSSTYGEDLIAFLQAVREAVGDAVDVTFTIPAQGWGTYWQTAAIGAQDYVTAINFMEYDIWINDSLPEPQYQNQIIADIVTYTAPPEQSPPQNWAAGWGLPASKIQVGLMPGTSDTGAILTVEDAVAITQYAGQQDLFGIMTWDINRDAQTDQTPAPFYTTPAPYEYEVSIRSIIELGEFPVPRQRRQVRNSYKRLRQRQATFTRESPPPHGAPD